MIRTRILQLVAVAVTLAWISLGVETLIYLGLVDRGKIASGAQSYSEKEVPFLDGRKKGLSDVDPTRVAEDVRKELDSGLKWNVLVIGLGALVAVVALAFKKFRAFAVLGSSLVYWGLWYRFGFPSEVGFIDAYQLKWLAANTLNSRGAFFFKDIVLPLIFTSSVVASLVSLVWSRFPRRPS